jgi:hypothetical protein
MRRRQFTTLLGGAVSVFFFQRHMWQIVLPRSIESRVGEQAESARLDECGRATD